MFLRCQDSGAWRPGRPAPVLYTGFMRTLAALILFYGLAAFAQKPCSEAAIYMPCEIGLEIPAEARAQHAHPYLSIDLWAEFRSPEYKTYRVPAFWAGAARMVFRFTPAEAGAWTYRITSNVPAWNGQTGSFTAAPTPPPAAFIRRANVHHWQYTEARKPHLYMGADDQPGFPVEAFAARKFTHLALVLLREASFADPDEPDPAYFNNLDARVAAIHASGITADFILAATPAALEKLFPSPRQRERMLRYITARYACFNATWQLTGEWEASPGARDLLKEVGLALKKLDPYGHPVSTRARDSSAYLGRDGWMDFTMYGPDRDDLIEVEHQANTVPQVALIDSALPPDQFRKRLWNAVMSGAYPVMTGAAAPDSANARAMEAWFHFMSARVRYWDTQPYFDVEGGRAIALPGLQTEDYDIPATEYLVYLEQPGKVSVTTRKHSYDVYWVNPSTGEALKEKKDWKGELYEATPPGAAGDWLLHLSRDGRKESMLRSYKFESWPAPVQEPERSPQKAPFELAQPTIHDTLVAGKPVPFKIQLKRQTRGTRRMTYVLTGEIVRDGEGTRFLASGAEGALTAAPMLLKAPSGVLNVRLAALNAAGKLYILDYVFNVKRGE